MNIQHIDAKTLVKMFKQGTANIVENKAIIDALNVFPVPDGDTGTNMSLTMQNAIDSLQDDYTTVGEVAKAISKGTLMGARGNSGVILSQIFRGFYKQSENLEQMDTEAFALALSQSADTAYKAVLKPVEGTILTVIREIGERAMALAEDDLSFNSFFEEILYAGELALANTPNLLPQLKQAGVVDAGGKGLLTILEGFYQALCGKETPLFKSSSVAKPLPAQAHMHTEDINFTYCTEFIVRGKDLDNAPLKEDIIDMGDSMVYVPDDDLIKVHIHTNDPGVIMQKALQYGELVKIKIENMKEQHGTILDNHGVNHQTTADTTTVPIGFVAVAAGSGITEIFKDLGVDVVIQGGQTMNPSTDDILKAIESVNAEHVIVLPNNSNVILAANQTVEIARCQVSVIPSKSMVQGIAAMLAYQADEDSEDNIEAMTEALSDVSSIQVTYAVRDTTVGDVTIQEGDYLGILNGDIICSEKDLIQTVLETIQQGVDDLSEMVSIYYGEAIEPEDAEALGAKVEAMYPGLEVEVYSGNQPVYYYLISIE